MVVCPTSSTLQPLAFVVTASALADFPGATGAARMKMHVACVGFCHVAMPFLKCRIGMQSTDLRKQLYTSALRLSCKDMLPRLLISVFVSQGRGDHAKLLGC